MAETSLMETGLSSKCKDLSIELPEILQFIEKKLNQGDKETQIDIKALNDKICYATYGAETLPFIYVLVKHIIELKDEALQLIKEEEKK